MRCDGCANWITAVRTAYDDGSTVTNREAPEGAGDCRHLRISTAPDFGCAAFAPGDDHVLVERKAGAPWQHFVMIDCPNCRGKGSDGGACHRCAGTGKVRLYDDGHVGEEQTRMHPKEREAAQAPPEVDPGTILAPLPKDSPAVVAES